jgi:hypothetical protein
MDRLVFVRHPAEREFRAIRITLWATFAAILAALLVYSQTIAFAWDEGFHLLAALLIVHGKRPYADFVFAQAPLNAYWNAALVKLFGNTWRAPHAAAAIETLGAVVLTTGYILRRFPLPEWRFRLGIVTAAFVGLNILVFQFGSIAQPYALCLLLMVSAFRLAVLAAERRSLVLTVLSGIAGGAAAACTLLSAPEGVVLLIWLVWRARSGRRISTFAALIAGEILGLGPLLVPLLRWPKQVIFDVVGYHIFYRQAEWDGWWSHDLILFTTWLDSVQVFVLLGLGLAGLIFVRRSNWDSAVRSEFYLCAWLAAVLSAYVATAHPTFRQYFVVAVPFVAILATAGCYAIVRHSSKPWAFAIVVAIVAAGLGRTLYDESDNMDWSDFDALVKEVNSVTPKDAPLGADESVYFLSGRIPPPGLEWTSGHKIDMPMDRARPLHVMPQKELDRQVKASAFTTFETCYDSEVDRLGLDRIYGQKKEVDDCYVFWDRRH